MLLLTERRDLGSLKRCHVEKTVGGVEVGRENRFWGEGLLFPGFSGFPSLVTADMPSHSAQYIQAGLGPSSLCWFLSCSGTTYRCKRTPPSDIIHSFYSSSIQLN